MQESSNPAVAIFNRYADLYAGRFMDQSLYSFSLDTFCKSIKKKNPAILDLFCGPGNISRYVLEKLPEAKLTGADLAPEMIRIAKEKNPSAEFKVMDCKDISILQKKFDGIIIGFGFPYLNKNEVQSLVSSLSEFINDDAIIYVSTMEDDYSRSGIEKSSQGDDVYIHYYPEEMISGIFNAAGFVSVYRERISNIWPNGKHVTDLILQFIKQDTKSAFIQRTLELTPEEKLIVNDLWDSEFSRQLIGKFESLLTAQSEFIHYLHYENGKINGWAATFNRDGEKWFSILVSRKAQHSGIGKKLMKALQADNKNLNGWMVDHANDLKSDGTAYPSPITFYEKLGFRIIPEIRSEKNNLSAVKISWP